MFEAAELGRKVSKKDYKRHEPDLHTRLLDIQREAAAANLAVIVVVSGVEGAGKGSVVSLLNQWFDARGVRTAAFWDSSDEEEDRPHFWRFWRALPPRGTIGILFGSWYTRPIIDHVFERTDLGSLDRELGRIGRLERMLSDDGALLVKFWFHLSKKEQARRLRRDVKEGRKSLSHDLAKRFAKHFDRFAAVSEHAIRATDSGQCPWHIVEATDARYRNLTVGATLLQAIRGRLDLGATATEPAAIEREPAPAIAPHSNLTVLDAVDLSQQLGDRQYHQRLEAAQAELQSLAWDARRKRRNVVAVFEGWDAGGKGGAIRRVTAAMDARLYRVISVAAPTDEEKAQHYLWRFWRHVPRAGYVTIYDRSWYGRVLVERVEGFASRADWMRAYREINEFEEQLAHHGAILLKFWLHISKDEQLRRFKEREATPWKHHKITDEDWRNREKWDSYTHAVNDMVTRTSTAAAPWTLVAGDDKRFARVQVIETFCERIRHALRDKR
jgi:polyphosphate:AMP phosphotransferase